VRMRLEHACVASSNRTAGGEGREGREEANEGNEDQKEE